MHILIQQSNKGSEGGGEAGVAKGVARRGWQKKMVERKTGVAREICHPHKYTSVHVYDSERRREEEKERERRRGCDLGGI